jgi:cytochrome oxidase Cu insertion factor (SCO1/SenC/PrrC family)
MKRIILSISVLAIAAVGLLSFNKNVAAKEELAIGATIPSINAKMKDVSGKELSLEEVKTGKGLLVIFSCNTCPYVKLSESRIKEIQGICKADGIGMIVVNSNEGQRDSDDSFEAMKKYASAQSYSAPYVLDAGSKLADAFGAGRTPQCFLFNTQKLIYKGAIDDNVKDVKLAKQNYLKDAIKALNEGKAVAVESSKSIGCTIKRAE